MIIDWDIAKEILKHEYYLELRRLHTSLNGSDERFIEILDKRMAERKKKLGTTPQQNAIHF